MEDLFNILSEGKAHVRVEMDAADLKAFSDELIRRAKDELGSIHCICSRHGQYLVSPFHDRVEE